MCKLTKFTYEMELKVRMLMMLTGPENVRWVHARQMGIKHVVAKLAPELTGKPSPWDEASLVSEKRVTAGAGAPALSNTHDFSISLAAPRQRRLLFRSSLT